MARIVKDMYHVEQLADRLLDDPTKVSLSALERVLKSCEIYGIGKGKPERIRRAIEHKRKLEESEASSTHMVEK